MMIKVVIMLVFLQVFLFGEAGDLDSSFGSGGIVTTDIAGGDYERISSIALQKDGKIVAVGDSNENGNGNFTIVRYEKNGSLDKFFGDEGKVIIKTWLISLAEDVVIQTDNKILVAGYSSESMGGGEKFTIVRLDASGKLDNSFGQSGIITTDINSSSMALGIVTQSDGKIIVAGGSGSGQENFFTMVRYEDNGTIDKTFGSNGIVITSLTGDATDIVLDKTGKILITGYDYSSEDESIFKVARYKTDGTIDDSFGTNGIAVTDLEVYMAYSLGLALQNDGKIVVVGKSGECCSEDFTVIRYEANGSIDKSFGENGIAITDVGGAYDTANNVAIQKDGKIVAGGYKKGGPDDFAVVRYDMNGTIDKSFGKNGIVTTDVGSDEDRAFGMALQSDGKIILAGRNSQDYVLVRYMNDLIIPVMAPIYYMLQ